ncbi:MAG: STAS domain-containing protein [Chloroflexaceae bacterium]|nr:STAS domain-containing protein [Chloroflexaceae bacterium]NJO07055.1 STAS domain-containing protein [Chloroflexaceae bacterium]
MNELETIAALQTELVLLRQRNAELEHQVAAMAYPINRSSVVPQPIGLPSLLAWINDFPLPLMLFDTGATIVVANTLVSDLMGWPEGRYPVAYNLYADRASYHPDMIAAFEQAREGVSTTLPPQHYHSSSSNEADGLPVATMLFPVHSANQVASVAVLFREITVQPIHNKEAYLQHELRLFQTLAENAPDGIAVFKGREITYANPSYRAMIGTSGMETALYGLPSSEDTLNLMTLVPTILEEGSWQGTMMVRDRTGSIIPAHVSAFTLYHTTGEAEGAAVIVRDVTEQLRREQEREEIQIRIIEAQRSVIRALSTPLIPIAEHILIMPLVGAIDTYRAHQVMDTLLHGVDQHRARVVIIDITGVDVIDSQIAQAMLDAARAVRLLGARVIMTGISPIVAQSIVQLGITLHDITTYGSLQAGITAALRSLKQ